MKVSEHTNTMLSSELLAQSSQNPVVDDILIKVADNIITPLIGLLFALALVVFLWGVFNFLRNAESSDGRSKGTQHILWGTVGMAIMISVFGIVNFLVGSLRNVGDVKIPNTPYSRDIR